jgi:hypothetical protein
VDNCGKTVDCTANACAEGVCNTGTNHCVQCVTDVSCGADAGPFDAGFTDASPYDGGDSGSMRPGPVCDDTLNLCVSCVVGGDQVSGVADCAHCCSGSCMPPPDAAPVDGGASATTCCTRIGLQAACCAAGHCCYGTAPDGCGGTWACEYNPDC